MLIGLLWSPCLFYGGLFLLYWFLVPQGVAFWIYWASAISVTLTDLLVMAEIALASLWEHSLPPARTRHGTYWELFFDWAFDLRAWLSGAGDSPARGVETYSVPDETALTYIVPAYLPNEAPILEETLLHYQGMSRVLGPGVKIVLVFNGGPAETYAPLLARLEELAGVCGFALLEAPNSHSKAENVNYALRYLEECGAIREGAVLAVMDADHRPRLSGVPLALEHLRQGADIVQGRCAIALPPGQGFLAQVIAMEYNEIYAVHHCGGAILHRFGVFGGSNGYFKAEVLAEVGMDESMLTEDIDCGLRALEKGKRIIFDRRIISEEQAPPSLGALWRQRLRWSQGWFQVTLRHVPRSWACSRVTLLQKFWLWVLLGRREIYYYLSPQCLVIGIVYLIKKERGGWYLGILAGLTLAMFCVPALKAAAACLLNQTGEPSLRVQLPTWRWKLAYLLVAPFYEFFKTTVAQISHLREILRLRKWEVTPRRL